MPSSPLPQPWKSFFEDINESLIEELESLKLSPWSIKRYGTNNLRDMFNPFKAFCG